MRPSSAATLDKIASTVLVSAALAGLIVAGYGAFKIEAASLLSLRVLVLVAFPAAVAVGCLGALRLSSAWRASFALTLVAVGIAVYGAEIWVGPAEAPRAGQAAARDSDRAIWGQGGEKLTRAELVQKLRDQEGRAFPVVSPANFVTTWQGPSGLSLTLDGKPVIPLAGVADVLTVLCRGGGEWIVYESDEYGFHNPKGLWASDRLDVAALGDSFTHGSCVPSEENAVARIRQRFPSTLNLAQSGNGPLLELATLREYLPRFRPSIVLWFFFDGNDIDNTAVERKDPILIRYLDPAFKQNLQLNKKRIDRALIEVAEHAFERARAAETDTHPPTGGPPPSPPQPVYRPMDFLLLRNLRNTLKLSFERPHLEVTYEVFQRALLEAKKAVGSWGGTLYFVYLPSYSTLEDEKSAEPRTHRAFVLETAAALDLPLIDLVPAFKEAGNPARFFHGPLGHYNSAGYRVVADTVLSAIERDQ